LLLYCCSCGNVIAALRWGLYHSRRGKHCSRCAFSSVIWLIDLDEFNVARVCAADARVQARLSAGGLYHSRRSKHRSRCNMGSTWVSAGGGTTYSSSQHRRMRVEAAATYVMLAVLLCGV
jgi:hypothetical protein